MLNVPNVGLVAACDHPQLLNFPLWPKQRELLVAAERHRINVWSLGRRSGKSTCAANTLVWDATMRPQLARYLRPGERRFCVGIATNLRQSRLLLEAARSIVRASPLLSSLLEGETEDELHFPGATIIALPATARGIRGFAVSSIVFDEMAHMLDADSNQAAEPLWHALVPATAQFGEHSRIVCASTPWGTGGLFHDLYSKAESGELEDAHAEHATTAQANPTVKPDFLRREFERDPESFAGEYEAQFLASGGAFIDATRIAECVGRTGLGRLDIIDPIIGCDLGFVSDPTAAVVLGRDPADQGRLVVARTRKWEPARATTFEERRHVEDSVLSDVAEIARYYGVPSTGRAALVVVDQHMRNPVASFFQRESVPVKVLALSAESKSLAFAELKARIIDQSIELPDDPDLLSELRGLRTQYRAGHSTVTTPRTSRGHSDLAVALALGVWESRHVGTSHLHADFIPDDDRPVWMEAERSLDRLRWSVTGRDRLSRNMRL
jgi:hypothetical protein